MNGRKAASVLIIFPGRTQHEPKSVRIQTQHFPHSNWVQAASKLRGGAGCQAKTTIYYMILYGRYVTLKQLENESTAYNIFLGKCFLQPLGPMVGDCLLVALDIHPWTCNLYS